MGPHTRVGRFSDQGGAGVRMNCLAVTVTRRVIAHNPIPVLYNKDGTECGWICQECGMCAQEEPETVEERQ